MIDEPTKEKSNTLSKKVKESCVEYLTVIEDIKLSLKLGGSAGEKKKILTDFLAALTSIVLIEQKHAIFKKYCEELIPNFTKLLNEIYTETE